MTTNESGEDLDLPKDRSVDVENNGRQSVNTGDSASDVDGRSLRDGDGEMPRVTVRLPEPTLNALDGLVDCGEYPNRSEAIRDALDEQIVLADGGQPVLEVTGSLDPATASEMDPPADGWFVIDEERDEWLVARPRNGGDA